MNKFHVYGEWNDGKLSSRFQTGVSLHGHTFHSRECLGFVPRVCDNVPYLSSAMRRQEAKYRALNGCELDLTRAWWTPPLSPGQALKLEAGQIENTLSLRALVLLSDHDNMDAGKCRNSSHSESSDVGREMRR